jgi:Transglutaminase-like superfamily
MADTAAPDWRWRRLVGEAMLRLVWARLLIAAIPLRHWRGLLGSPSASRSANGSADAETRLIAQAVVRGANRLPFTCKCLPQAVALHAMLRRRAKPSRLVIAVLDPGQRGTFDNLHAWVESGGDIVIGALENPFHPIVSFG